LKNKPKFHENNNNGLIRNRYRASKDLGWGINLYSLLFAEGQQPKYFWYNMAHGLLSQDIMDMCITYFLPASKLVFKETLASTR